MVDCGEFWPFLLDLIRALPAGFESKSQKVMVYTWFTVFVSNHGKLSTCPKVNPVNATPRSEARCIWVLFEDLPQP